MTYLESQLTGTNTEGRDLIMSLKREQYGSVEEELENKRYGQK